MTEDFVQVAFDRIVQTRAYTAIVLRDKDFRFAIFSEEGVGKFLQSHLGGEERYRPKTHDLLSSILQMYEIRVLQVLINDVQNSVFFSRVFLEMMKEGLRHIVEIDARPSDSIILAFLQNAPVLCARHVLEKVVPFAE
jgi:bifunctional DNase/RNase